MPMMSLLADSNFKPKQRHVTQGKEKASMSGLLASAFVTKLSCSNLLDAQDIGAIQQLPMKVRRLGAGQLIVAEGDRPVECCLVGSGFVFRSKLTSEGQRQVLSLHIPGEIPDLQSLHLKVMDHDLVTLTNCTLGFIAHEDLRNLNRLRPAVSDALWREILVDAAIFRERVVSLGRRPALPRLAHFLVELEKRLQSVGLTSKAGFKLPITQIQIADCLGLSTVHVNRVIKELRRNGDLAVHRDFFELVHPSHLEQLAGFDPSYLHLGPDE
jgi:CRP-like cAMP-binding protein